MLHKTDSLPCTIWGGGFHFSCHNVEGTFETMTDSSDRQNEVNESTAVGLDPLELTLSHVCLM